jgi:hypothetical protein
LLLWVKGWMLEWYFNSETTVNPTRFKEHFDVVYMKVYEYLRGNQKLDGGCSDLECLAASRAYEVFKDRFTRLPVDSAGCIMHFVLYYFDKVTPDEVLEKLRPAMKELDIGEGEYTGHDANGLDPAFVCIDRIQTLETAIKIKEALGLIVVGLGGKPYVM